MPARKRHGEPARRAARQARQARPWQPIEATTAEAIWAQRERDAEHDDDCFNCTHLLPEHLAVDLRLFNRQQ